MIFLGAGASKAFGIKTLQEMTVELEKFMESKGHLDLINSIEVNLEKYKIDVDFEALYGIVEAMANPVESLRKVL
jgi:hypothetical protein